MFRAISERPKNVPERTDSASCAAPYLVSDAGSSTLLGMEQSFDHSQFWNALTQGGDAARSAIEGYQQLPELKRGAIVTNLLNRALGSIDELLHLETVKNRPDFKVKKDGLCTLLDSVPALAMTPQERASAITQVKEIDVKSRVLLDMDILMKCDEVEEALKRPKIDNPFKNAQVIEVSSIEELQEQLGVELPPELKEKIEKNGGAVMLGLFAKKKKDQ